MLRQVALLTDRKPSARSVKPVRLIPYHEYQAHRIPAAPQPDQGWPVPHKSRPPHAAPVGSDNALRFRCQSASWSTAAPATEQEYTTAATTTLHWKGR